MAQKKPVVNSAKKSVTAGKPKPNTDISRKRTREIIGVALIAFALFAGLCVFSPSSAGIIGSGVQGFILGMFGMLSYIFPILLIIIGAMTIISHRKKINGGKLATMILLCVSVLSLLHIFFIADLIIESFSKFVSDSYTLGVTSRVGAGVIGAIPSYIFIKLIGGAGSGILFVTLILICIMMLFNFSISKVSHQISEHIQQKAEQKKRSKLFVDELHELPKGYSDLPELDLLAPRDFMKTRDKQTEPADLEALDIAQRPDILTEELPEYLQHEPPVIKYEKPAKKEYDPQSQEMKIEIQATLPPAPYHLPPISLLDEMDENEKGARKEDPAHNARILENTLLSFGITAKVVQISCGPVITRYELQLAPGIKVSRVVSLADDIAMNLAAAGVRIEAPIPGKAAIGIEVPNRNISTVALRQVIANEEFFKHPSNLSVAFGKDIAGKNLIADIAKMPHLLIAGATGAGKSVCINTLIMSILFKATPDQVRLILIDPKVVELSVYNGIAHLLIPVVTDPKKAAGALQWAVNEMTQRYKRFAEKTVREIHSYNQWARNNDEETLPQIVVVIDELADLMMTAPADVEDRICRLAQLGRAAGIHLVVATQRPSVDVITGIIKANIPSRIAFTVSSQVDSRTILDIGGAEKLLGKGDMLFFPANSPKPIRAQGAFVSDSEVERVTDYIRKQAECADYNEDIIEHMEHASCESTVDDQNEYDDLLPDAIEFVIDSGQASISMLQRRLRIGYARAGRLIDEMEKRGLVSTNEGSKPRNVLIGKDEFRRLFGEDSFDINP